MLYAKIPAEHRLPEFYQQPFMNMAAMLVAILKKQLRELGPNVEKILYGKKSRRNRGNQTLVSDHFDYSGHVGGHLGKKSCESHLGIERTQCAQSHVKIHHRLGGEAVGLHTDTRTKGSLPL